MSNAIQNRVYVSQCVFCRHKIPWENTGTSRCAAFPKGIPRDVRRNIVLHNKPLEGDHGIQFEPLEDDGFIGELAQGWAKRMAER